MSTLKKRQLDGGALSAKSKRPRLNEAQKKKAGTKAQTPTRQQPSILIQEDVDFPRGGGTSLTPLEVKTIRAEAAKEADEALFKVCAAAHIECVLNIEFYSAGSCGQDFPKKAQVRL
jgi:rRNA biogenesis protein RRP5